MGIFSLSHWLVVLAVVLTCSEQVHRVPSRLVRRVAAGRVKSNGAP
jgi:hypothetical protein